MFGIKIVTLLAFLFFLSACGATTGVLKRDRGGVILSPDLEFPESQFLTATGIGQSEGEARRLAKAELSNIFEARVTSDVSSSVKSVVAADSNEEVTRTAKQSVRVVSDLKLKGVRIGKVWYDDSRRSHYALAVLDREQAKDNWMREILDIDGRAEAGIAATRSRKSEFSRLQTLKKVRRLWLEREVLASRLRVLGYKDLSVAPYDIRSVFNRMQQIKTNLLIYINPGRGKYARLTASQISEMLGKEGFVLSDRKREANILITGTVTVEAVDLPGKDWEFARANAALSIVDAATGLIVGEVTENKRSGHLRFSEAANKAIRKVSRALSGKLVAYFGI